MFRSILELLTDGRERLLLSPLASRLNMRMRPSAPVPSAIENERVWWFGAQLRFLPTKILGCFTGGCRKANTSLLLKLLARVFPSLTFDGPTFLPNEAQARLHIQSASFAHKGRRGPRPWRFLHPSGFPAWQRGLVRIKPVSYGTYLQRQIFLAAVVNYDTDLSHRASL